MTLRYALLLFLFSLGLGGCAKNMMFNVSPVLPAAEGKVSIRKDANSNYAISIDMRHFADSKRLTPPKATYVVWIDTEKNGFRNIGMLNSAPGTLTAYLRAVTSFKPTLVFITAEDDGNIQMPGGTTVLITKEFNIK